MNVLVLITNTGQLIDIREFFIFPPEILSKGIKDGKLKLVIETPETIH
jgi:hypothetical protein